MIAVSVRLSDPEYRRLKAEAASGGVSMSEVMRRHLRIYLRKLKSIADHTDRTRARAQSIRAHQ